MSYGRVAAMSVAAGLSLSTSCWLGTFTRARLDEAAHLRSARAARDAGDYGSALRELGLADASGTNAATGLRELADLAMVSGRYELAVRAYVRTLQANPRDRAAQGYLGCALTRIGRDSLGSRFLARAGAGPWTRCTDSDELAVELRGAAETHALLALALLTRGRYEEALAESRTALRMDRNRDDAHDNAGEALLRLGKIDSAEAEFRTAIWLRPEEPEYHFDLARALAGENRLAEAATEAREAQRLDPADERYRSFSILLQVKQLALRA